MSDFGINLDAICDNVKYKSPSSRTGSQVSNRSSRRMDFVDEEELSTYFNSKASVTQSDSCSNDLTVKNSIITEAVVCDESGHVSADAIQEKEDSIMQMDDNVMKWMMDSHDGISMNGGINFSRSKSKTNKSDFTETKSEISASAHVSAGISSQLGMFNPVQQNVKKEIISEMFEDEDVDGCTCRNCCYREKYLKLRNKMKSVLVDLITEM
uniref:Non-structural protein 5 n=1 Tax=Porcine rotavirus C TaxID=10968 RepID=A0A2Z5W3Y4_9REOV|nr:nonstructural protein 5 [Porcine rotavirus C]BBB44563.1 nonstructural protein 5 [Porcine rotavirus C]BBB44564.1 nonstructural protein 5 [Porcine rotavirus C]